MKQAAGLQVRTERWCSGSAGGCRARENQWGAEEERGVRACVAEPDKHIRDLVDMPMWRVAQAEGSRK